MDRRELFNEILDDLQARLEETPSPASPYTLIKMSGLLRELLLDEQALLDQVTKSRKIRPSFRIAVGGPYEDMVLSLRPTFWAPADDLDPDTALVPTPTKRVNVPELLSTRIMIIGGYEYTIREVIRQLAHVEGGVHAGKPKGEKERILTDAATQMTIGGYAPQVAAIRAVGRVVYKGLIPLKAQFEQELRAETAQPSPKSTVSDNTNSSRKPPTRSGPQCPKRHAGRRH